MSSGEADLQRARLWSESLSATLTDVVAEVDRITRRVAEGWPDPRGTAWRERLLAARTELQRDADAAAELGRMIDRLDAAGAPGVGSRTERTGPRLGSTEARRADDERGVDIPWLGESRSG
jgi:hypothetical protein